MKALRRLRARIGWNRLWGNPAYAPDWFIDGPRHPVREAVSDGWFPRGCRVLELGCGIGQEAAWLAREGFDVLGVDISRHAIERAQREHRDIGSLSFLVVDVTAPAPLGIFDAIIDAGCLHCIPPRLLADCAENLQAWSAPGTRLLVMMNTTTATTAERIHTIETTLTPAFRVISIDEAADPAHAGKRRPRVVARLERT